MLSRCFQLLLMFSSCQALSMKTSSYLSVHIVCSENALTPVCMETSLGHLALSFSEECASPLVVVGCIVLYLTEFPMGINKMILILIFHPCLMLEFFVSSSQCMNSQGG